MLEHLPLIGEEQIKDETEELSKQIAKGQVTEWLTEELRNLHDKNPVLFHYIVNRANTFAVGTAMMSNAHSISVSLAMEYLLLLKIIDTGIGNTARMTQFTDMMKGWLKDEDLKGLNDVGNGKNSK